MGTGPTVNVTEALGGSTRRREYLSSTRGEAAVASPTNIAGSVRREPSRPSFDEHCICANKPNRERVNNNEQHRDKRGAGGGMVTGRLVYEHRQREPQKRSRRARLQQSIYSVFDSCGTAADCYISCRFGFCKEQRILTLAVVRLARLPRA